MPSDGSESDLRRVLYGMMMGDDLMMKMMMMMVAWAAGRQQGRQEVAGLNDGRPCGGAGCILSNGFCFAVDGEVGQL